MLDKVIMLISENVLQEKILCVSSSLPEDLQEHGVELVIVQGKAMAACGEAREAAVPYGGMASGEAKSIETEVTDRVCDGTEGAAGILYVTDSEVIYHSLREQGKYVLPYRHEKNREADFTGAPYVMEQIEEADYESFDLAYRRLAGLPWEILRTVRCIIRETTEADVDSFYHIYAAPEITRYMENLYENQEEELAYVKEYREKVYGFYGYGMWTVLKQDGTVIGRAGISWREGYGLPELGFVIGVPWQRQGYACEVCSAILDYAREELGFTRVQALVMEGNEQSAALCRKLGFVQAGTAVEDGERYAVYEWNRQ